MQSRDPSIGVGRCSILGGQYNGGKYPVTCQLQCFKGTSTLCTPRHANLEVYEDDAVEMCSNSISRSTPINDNNAFFTLCVENALNWACEPS